MAGLKREIREETKLEIDEQIRHLCNTNFMRKQDHVINLIFLCKYKSGEVTLDESHSEYKWINSFELGIIESYAELKNKVEGPANQTY